MNETEMQAAWQEFLTTRDAELRDQLILAHMWLVRSVAGQLRCGRDMAIDREDLMSAGTVGLIQAVDRFDPTRGQPFPAFARLRILGSMLDELRRLSQLSRQDMDRLRAIRAAENDLAQTTGRTPSRAEVAEHAGIRPDDVALLSASVQNVRFATGMDSAPDDDSEAGIPGRFLVDPEQASALERIERRDEYRQLTTALKGLGSRDRHMLHLLYQDLQPGTRVAHTLGISPGRVSQLRRAALGRLRSALSAPAPVPA